MTPTNPVAERLARVTTVATVLGIVIFGFAFVVPFAFQSLIAIAGSVLVLVGMLSWLTSVLLNGFHETMRQASDAGARD
jgi:hypothetical protein